jgi:hypothetical protein
MSFSWVFSDVQLIYQSFRMVEKKKKAMDRAQEMLHKLEVQQTDKVSVGEWNIA